MKQKIVIKVSAVDHKKGPSKALEIAASISGVESIALLGEENDEIEVIGDEVDVVGLARTLRKKIGHAEVLKVGPADQKKEKENEKESTNTSTLPSNYPYEYYYYYYYSAPYYIYNDVPSHEPYCSIL